MFCLQCGNEIMPGMAFCTKCGTRVEDEDDKTMPITRIHQPKASVMANASQNAPQSVPESASKSQAIGAGYAKIDVPEKFVDILKGKSIKKRYAKCLGFEECPILVTECIIAQEDNSDKMSLYLEVKNTSDTVIEGVYFNVKGYTLLNEEVCNVDNVAVIDIRIPAKETLILPVIVELGEEKIRRVKIAFENIVFEDESIWNNKDKKVMEQVDSVEESDDASSKEAEEELKKQEEERALAEQKRLEEEKKLAEQKRLEEEKKLAEQKRLEEEKKLAEQKRLEEERRKLEAEEKARREQIQAQENERRLKAEKKAAAAVLEAESAKIAEDVAAVMNSEETAHEVKAETVEIPETPVKLAFCMQCGFKIIPGNAFCIKCGNKIG